MAYFRLIKSYFKGVLRRKAFLSSVNKLLKLTDFMMAITTDLKCGNDYLKAFNGKFIDIFIWVYQCIEQKRALGENY